MVLMQIEDGTFSVSLIHRIFKKLKNKWLLANSCLMNTVINKLVIHQTAKINYRERLALGFSWVFGMDEWLDNINNECLQEYFLRIIGKWKYSRNSKGGWRCLASWDHGTGDHQRNDEERADNRQPAHRPLESAFRSSLLDCVGGQNSSWVRGACSPTAIEETSSRLDLLLS